MEAATNPTITWDEAYEQVLSEKLREWSTEQIEAAQAARREFADKIVADGLKRVRWGTSGAFGHALRWEQGRIIRAELREQVALAANRYLQGEEATENLPSRDAQPASKVMPQLRDDLDRVMRETIRQSSTSPASNYVDSETTKEAYDLLRDGWNDLGRIEHEAKYEARRAIVGDRDKLIRQTSRELAQLKAKLGRAKSDASIGRIAVQIAEAEHSIRIQKQNADAVLVAAGGPEWDRS